MRRHFSVVVRLCLAVLLVAPASLRASDAPSPLPDARPGVPALRRRRGPEAAEPLGRRPGYPAAPAHRGQRPRGHDATYEGVSLVELLQRAGMELGEGRQASLCEGRSASDRRPRREDAGPVGPRGRSMKRNALAAASRIPSGSQAPWDLRASKHCKRRHPAQAGWQRCKGP